jgi:hypothetical protein
MEVQPEDVIESGSLTVEVRNPLPGGGLSNKLLIAVVDPVPVIDSISPDTGGVGGAHIHFDRKWSKLCSWL